MSCRYFDLDRYPNDPGQWSDCDWPQKVWERLATRSFSRVQSAYNARGVVNEIDALQKGDDTSECEMVVDAFRLGTATTKEQVESSRSNEGGEVDDEREPLDLVRELSDSIDSIPATCPHQALDGMDLCPFHLPPEQAAETGYDAEQLAELFLRRLDETNVFVGANFEELPLQRRTLTCPDNSAIKLDFCTVETLSLRKANVRRDLSLDYAMVGEATLDKARFKAELSGICAVIKGDLKARWAAFRDELNLSGVEFEGSLNVRSSRFDGPVNLDGVSVSEKGYFWNSHFREDADIRNVIFDGQTDFKWGTFDGFPDFEATVFEGAADFGGVRFREDAGFADVHFKEIVTFRGEYNGLNEYGAHFLGSTDFGNVEFGGEAIFHEATFANFTNFDGATFEDKCSLYNTDFEGVVSFCETEFCGPVRAEWADFVGFPDFEAAKFRDKANFGGVTFHDDAGFSKVIFSQGVSFRGQYSGFRGYETEIKGTADFRGAEFCGDSEFSIKFMADVSFAEACFYEETKFTGEFRGDALFNEANFKRKVTFGVEDVDEATDTDDEVEETSEFHGSVSFRRTHFMSDVNFQSVEFLDTVYFDGTTSEEVINLSDSVLTAGKIVQPTNSRTLYDLSNATIGDVSLEPKDEKALSGKTDNLFDYFQFWETKFDGFNFPNHGRVLNGHWNIHEFLDEANDKQYDELASTYLKAKNGADDAGANVAAAEFFLREMRYRRKGHGHRCVSESAGQGLIDRTQSGGRWLSNWLLNLSCGYGERPLRTVLSSVVLVLIFTIVYAILGIKSVETPVSYLTFSIQSFVTLILGGTPRIQSLIVQFVASFEAFMGAFLIALFVFSLTRSVHR